MEENSELTVSYKFEILRVLQQCTEDTLKDMKTWLTTGKCFEDLENYRNIVNQEEYLKNIAGSLKNMIPEDGVLPSEVITKPEVGENADCDDECTVHLDEFIYDDDDLDTMVKDGTRSNYYCLECGSQKTEELNIISHSLSRDRISYAFHVLLPSNLEEKQILDVGSRVGAILFGAYYLSDASSIIGVEMNKDLCDIQNKIIEQQKISTKRVRVIHSDILEQGDVLQNTNVLFLNNVFEFFNDTRKQIEIWYFLKKKLRKGTYIISIPSIRESVENLGVEKDFTSWVQMSPPSQIHNEVYFNTADTDYSDMHFYYTK